MEWNSFYRAFISFNDKKKSSSRCVLILFFLFFFCCCYYSFSATCTCLDTTRCPSPANADNLHNFQVDVEKNIGEKDNDDDDDDETIMSMEVISFNIGRRVLSGPGSSPPRCTSKCGKCTPCKPVHVPVPPGTPVTAEYYPEAWRCKCGNKLYMP